MPQIVINLIINKKFEFKIALHLNLPKLYDSERNARYTIFLHVVPIIRMAAVL